MEGFAALLGHLIGDCILQTDFIAKWKTNPAPTALDCEQRSRQIPESVWLAQRSDFANLICLLHCVLYTASVWFFCSSWMTWPLAAICLVLHYPIDRFRLARWWMMKVSNQREFATGPFSPWSIILVDNIAHLLTIYVLFWLRILHIWSLG